MFASPYSISTIKPQATIQKKPESSSLIESQKETKETFLISAILVFSHSYHKKMHSKKKSKSLILRSASAAANVEYQRTPKRWLYFLPKPQRKMHAIPKPLIQANKAFGFSAAPVMTPLKGVTHTRHFTEKKAMTDSSAGEPMILSMADKATTPCTQAEEKTFYSVMRAMTF